MNVLWVFKESVKLCWIAAFVVISCAAFDHPLSTGPPKDTRPDEDLSLYYFRATLENNVQLFNELLQMDQGKGVDQGSHIKTGETCFRYAALHGYDQLVSVMIARNLAHGSIEVELLKSFSIPEKVLKILLQSGYIVFFSINARHHDLLKHAISNINVDLNSLRRAENGLPPFFYALEKRNLAGAQILSQYGASDVYVDEEGRTITALGYVLTRFDMKKPRSLKMLDFLLKKIFVNPNAPFYVNTVYTCATPLGYAIILGDKCVISKLFISGALLTGVAWVRGDGEVVIMKDAIKAVGLSPFFQHVYRKTKLRRLVACL